MKTPRLCVICKKELATSHSKTVAHPGDCSMKYRTQRYREANPKKEAPPVEIKARKATDSEDGPPKNSREDEISDDAWSIKMTSDRVKSYPELVRACDVDLGLWEADRFKCKSYEVTYVPRSTRPDEESKWIRPSSQAVTVTMFAISASFKKIKAVASARDILAEAKKEFRNLFPDKIAAAPPSHKPTGNVLEMNISDHHFGKLSWGQENGGKPWDLEISKKSWRDAVSYLLDGTAHYVYDEAILVVGNDIVHVDGIESATTAGTRVDSDGRYPKVYLAVMGELLWTIRLLRQRGLRVRVVIIPGNHDVVSCFTIGVALSLAFECDAGVHVDNSPAVRKVYAFGKCLVGWEHGHAGKHKNRPLNLAVEHPDLWGKSVYREIHTGHVHHEVVEDFQSVIVRQVSALGPNDAWHQKNGYIALRKAEAFIWNKERGLIGTCIYSTPEGKVGAARQ